MKLKHYELIILLVSLFLGYEYLSLNNLIEYESNIKLFVLHVLHLKKFNFSPVAGYPISYFLGWLGFATMLITNLYIIRKRLHIWEGFGKTAGWLDFHIFCGLIGPVFIIFHSNFKVDGLVSISFWSMVICSSSGIVGRYFYLQTLRKKEEINKDLAQIRKKFSEVYAKKISEEKLDLMFSKVLVVAGAREDISNPMSALTASMVGDIKLMFSSFAKGFGIRKSDLVELKRYGRERRRIIFMAPFTQLLGYWHAFHLPFAVFMYIVAVLHIIAALLFGVKH